MVPLVWVVVILVLVVNGRQNAVILILCRNDELNGIIKSISSFEEQFNKRHKYPYVFLNDKEFTAEFKRRIEESVGQQVKFGKVEAEDWEMPRTIQVEKARNNWKRMVAAGVPYADKESYHNMCRFFSRTFYKHPLVQNYEYYWRIEPNVQFYCDIDEDPFDKLKNNRQKYGFVITINEFLNSISTLMDTTAEFIKKYYERMPKKNRMRFMYENGRYNGCHFWSNFEIAAFEFFRSKEYNDFVDALEESGGFYYERWGDAPVHSVAASLLLDKSEIHFFEKIGYTHDGITHCPSNGKNCKCTVKQSIDFTPFSCLTKYLADRATNN